MKPRIFLYCFVLLACGQLTVVRAAQYENQEDFQQASPIDEDFADEYVQPHYTPTRNYPLTRECIHSYSKAAFLVFDSSERHIYVNKNKLLGTCPCQSRCTQSIFTARHTSLSEDEDIEVRVECPDMRRFCMCSESGQCYTPTGMGTVTSVGFTPFCDGGGCHMYAILNGDSDSGLEGDQANVFRVRDQLQEDGTPRRPSSDSVYLKAKSLSCNGCSTIQSITTCTGPFRDTNLNSA